MQLKRTTNAHIECVYNNMRDVDYKEFLYLFGMPISKEWLLGNLAHRRAIMLTAIVNNKICAILGVGQPIHGTEGRTLWAVCTHDLQKNIRPAIRLCRHFIPLWAKRFGCLHNVVWADNTPAVNTLHTLGANFVLDYTVEIGEKFRLFEFRG